MTDEELKELVAETSRQVRDLKDSQAQQARDQQAALASVSASLSASLSASAAETERILGEQSRELREELRDLARSQKRTDKQLGELGNRLGGFTEGLALPSIREILYERFGVDAVVTDARARRNGSSLQIDAVGITNGDVNEAYLVEIKSRLREEGLLQIQNHLASFSEFFPEHRGKTLYGILAAVDVPDELEKRVLNQGIYLAKIHGDLFELVLPDGFEPRGFPG